MEQSILPQNSPPSEYQEKWSLNFFFQILTRNANRAFTALFHSCPCWDCTLFHSLFLLCYHGIGNAMSEQSPQCVWGKLESEFWPKRWLLYLTLLTSKSTVNANVSKECWALKAVDVWILPLIRTHNKKKRSLIFFFFCCAEGAALTFLFPLLDMF